MNILQKEIKDFLAVSRWTQTDLARAANVPQTTISTLLSGRRKSVTWITADRLRQVMREAMSRFSPDSKISD